MDHDNALGEFLRAQRERRTAADAGLPEYGLRRVPGLRREEVALLAGVSVDYYTRLEQGRERHPSEQVLDAVSRALKLDAHAAGYLFRLVQPAPPSAAVPSSQQVSAPLTDLLVHALDVPATVTGPALDVLAANDLARALYGSFARFDNLVRMVFLDPAARDFYADWDSAARGVVSNLRAASAPFLNDPRVLAVVGEMTVRSPAFLAYWARREVRPRANENKHLHHAQVGDLHLQYQAFHVSDAPGQQVYVYTAPPGSPSADGLALLRRLTAEGPRTTSDDRSRKGHS